MSFVALGSPASNSLVWNARAVAGSYERARGLRAAVGKHTDAFMVTVSRTVTVPVATRPKSAF